MLSNLDSYLSASASSSAMAISTASGVHGGEVDRGHLDKFSDSLEGNIDLGKTQVHAEGGKVEVRSGALSSGKTVDEQIEEQKRQHLGFLPDRLLAHEMEEALLVEELRTFRQILKFA